jgi:hypothetical protein
MIAFLPQGENGAVFPYMVYMVPNALFPLMALFVWLDLERYEVYTSLYTAGKIIAVISFMAWLIFSSEILIFFVPEGRAELVLLGASVIITIGDTLSIVGGSVLLYKVKRSKREMIQAAAVPAAEDSSASEQGGV